MFEVVYQSTQVAICVLKEPLPRYYLSAGVYLRLPTKHRWYVLHPGGGCITKAYKSKTLDALFKEATCV